MVNKIFPIRNFIFKMRKMLGELSDRVYINTRKYVRLIRSAQLCLIYFIGMVVLTVSLRRMLGYFPPYLEAIWPLAGFILKTPLLSWFGRSETMIYIYLLTFEFLVIRPIIRLSMLVKFNILLVCFLELIYNLIICWWDVIYIRELSYNSAPFVPAAAFTNFMIALFLVFYGVYMYCFIFALQNKVPPFPGVFKKIPDSAIFWLRIKKKKKME